MKKIISWANKKLLESFNFDLFVLLVECDAHISTLLVDRLKLFLRNKISVVQSNPSNSNAIVFPSRRPYEELVQVGYWCLINVLKSNDFKDFLGISPEFDFLCE